MLNCTFIMFLPNFTIYVTIEYLQNLKKLYLYKKHALLHGRFLGKNNFLDRYRNLTS